ncbi:MAG: hypothetical protein IPM21_09840 [Acidobacteria bacterium]|nr:hypothetical protein [Acidobacteriota bacterium]
MRYATILVFAFALFAGTANGCVAVVSGLRKQFREANVIFTGQLIEFEERSNANIPAELLEDWKTLAPVRFKIERSWKGQRSGELVLYMSPICDCPVRYLLPNKGDTLLVFADKDGIVDSCNYGYVLEMKNEKQAGEAKSVMKRLDSFWFRTWARIYPF